VLEFTRRALGWDQPDDDPDIPYDRALRALKGQLAKLDSLRSQRHDEAEADESGWIAFTQSVIVGTFGKSSLHLKSLESARWSGEHNLFEMSEQDLQRNFELRLRAFEVLSRNLIEEVRLRMPDDDIQGAYEPGEQYELYRDLSKIISRTTRQVMIIDAYLDEQSFNLYVDKADKAIAICVLSNRISNNLETAAKLCAAGRTLQLRASQDVHDRAVFSDDRGWVLGQSLKDAAKAKPTYLVELTEPALTALRVAHDNVWARAAQIV
jgi:hypothetical protein